jgi:hypothetical protein
VGVDDIDYGPLAALVGTWQGDKGMDVAPEPDGTEENPYYETIVFEAAGDVSNAETQTHGRRFEHTDTNQLTRTAR